MSSQTRASWALGEGGKDVVVVAAREELAAPSTVVLPEPEPAPGLLLPDGSINWGCPCLGGMATGPCGPQFRDAFECFHYRYKYNTTYLGLNREISICPTSSCCGPRYIINFVCSLKEHNIVDIKYFSNLL